MGIHLHSLPEAKNFSTFYPFFSLQTFSLQFLAKSVFAL